MGIPFEALLPYAVVVTVCWALHTLQLIPFTDFDFRCFRLPGPVYQRYDICKTEANVDDTQSTSGIGYVLLLHTLAHRYTNNETAKYIVTYIR